MNKYTIIKDFTEVTRYKYYDERKFFFGLIVFKKGIYISKYTRADLTISEKNAYKLIDGVVYIKPSLFVKNGLITKTIYFESMSELMDCVIDNYSDYPTY